VVQITSPQFKENAARAIGDAGLQKALGKAKGAFLQRRGDAVARLPEFEQLRDIGRDIKNHTLANLDFYLETYAANVEEIVRTSVASIDCAVCIAVNFA
jgi:L-lactate dehydrogenase complex protein LldF